MPFDLEAVRNRIPDREIIWFPTVISTMILAGDFARAGCASGTVVGADEQVAGVGRHGHSWHSEAEAGLYVSVVLRLEIPPNVLPVVMLALGIATQEAISGVTGLAVDLRWPNDVMIGGKKCAGILAQMESDAVIAGIGINVNHAAFPPDIEALATSLLLEGKRRVSREDVLVALLRSVDACCNLLLEEGPDAIRQMFTRASSYAEGRRVRVEKDGAIIEGTTCGLDSSGFLRVREDTGRETTILAGGVRPAAN